jgi:hypothetical protein
VNVEHIDPELYEKGQTVFVQLILTEIFIGHQCCQLTRAEYLSAERISSLLRMASDALATVDSMLWRLDAAHRYQDFLIAEIERLRLEYRNATEQDHQLRS